MFPLIVFSIFLTLEGSQFKAFALIYLGYEFDRLDGIVARRRNETSELGRQLDSLSDLVPAPQLNYEVKND